MIQNETFSTELLNSQLYDTPSHPGAERSILDAIEVFLRRKALIATVTLGFTCLGAISVLRTPPKYKADATILPPQQQQSSLSSLAGALGGLASSGMASQLGLKNIGDLYVGILKSRTIADEIVSAFNLQKIYHKKLKSDARKALSTHVSFANGKDSLITISVTDRDPQLAAALANAFVDELHKQNSRLAVTDASQRRLFFEEQLNQQRDALANAELALKQTQQSTGLLVPAGQAEMLIRSGAQLRAEIASREVQLQAMRAYATDENPQVMVLKREIAALNGQLSTVQSNGASASDFELSGSKLPQASLEYVRRVREMKYHETLYELLAKQYEAARIDEAKQAPIIQVVDRAVVPDKEIRPSRMLIVGGAFLFGLLLSCLSVIGMQRVSDFASHWKTRQEALLATGA